MTSQGRNRIRVWPWLTPARIRRGFHNLRPTTTPSSQRTKTLTTRTRTPTRLHKPPARPPTRRWQEHHHVHQQRQDRLNNKLRAVFSSDVPTTVANTTDAGKQVG